MLWMRRSELFSHRTVVCAGSCAHCCFVHSGATYRLQLDRQSPCMCSMRAHRTNILASLKQPEAMEFLDFMTRHAAQPEEKRRYAAFHARYAAPA